MLEINSLAFPKGGNKMKEFYTVDESADYLGITRQDVLDYIYYLRLSHIDVNDHFLISKETLDEKKRVLKAINQRSAYGIAPKTYARFVKLGYIKEDDTPNYDGPNFRKYSQSELSNIFGISSNCVRSYIGRYNWNSNRNQCEQIFEIREGISNYISENDMRKLLCAHPDKLVNNKLCQLIMYHPAKDDEIAALREKIIEENGGKYKIH